MQKILSAGIILSIIIGISLFTNISYVTAEGHIDGIAGYAAAYDETTSIPPNCSASNPLLCCCLPYKNINDVVLPLGQITSNRDVYLNLSPTSLTCVIVPDIPGIPQHASALELLPSPPGAEFRCRDGLNSEEPPSSILIAG